MRIIGGEYKRRVLKALPKGVETRPVPDQVREALFNLLRGHFDGESVLDLFSGTGSIALEALSRGASRVVCVERDRRVASVIEENARELGCEDRIDVACADALGAAAVSRCPRDVHVIMMDPPYPMVRDPETWPRVVSQFVRLAGMLDDKGYAVIRTPWPFVHVHEEEDGERREHVGLELKGLLGPETHAYGTTALHLYMKDPDAGVHRG